MPAYSNFGYALAGYLVQRASASRIMPRITSYGRSEWRGPTFKEPSPEPLLSRYLRPMGGKVPSIYGPSADEGLPARASA